MWVRVGSGLRLGLRFGMLPAILAAGLAAATAAHATDLKTAGVWTAFVVKNTQGQNVCGVMTSWADGREFDIEWFEGESVLTIQVLKNSWDIPPHVRPKVSMNFPGAKPWEAQGLDLDHSTHIVEVSVPHDVVKPFSHDFATAATGTLSFPGGSEPAWDLNMTGFVVTLQAMVKCIDDIAGPASPSTPYAYLHTPQPGAAPTPPAPFQGARNSSDTGKLGQE